MKAYKFVTIWRVKPIARPLFEWNHNVVMSWGARGLAERLGASVVGLYD